MYYMCRSVRVFAYSAVAVRAWPCGSNCQAPWLHGQLAATTQSAMTLRHGEHTATRLEGVEGGRLL
jgi:hypothetical protein